MPIDRTMINQAIDRQLEAIEKQVGADVEVDNVCFLLAFKHEGKPGVRFRYTGAPYIALGMLRAAEHGILTIGESVQTDHRDD
jgi:hypothetical protein